MPSQQPSSIQFQPLSALRDISGTVLFSAFTNALGFQVNPFPNDKF